MYSEFSRTKLPNEFLTTFYRSALRKYVMVRQVYIHVQDEVPKYELFKSKFAFQNYIQASMFQKPGYSFHCEYSVFYFFFLLCIFNEGHFMKHFFQLLDFDNKGNLIY